MQLIVATEHWAAPVSTKPLWQRHCEVDAMKTRKWVAESQLVQTEGETSQVRHVASQEAQV